MFRIKNTKLTERLDEIGNFPNGKFLINTIYAYSYYVAQKDALFAESLSKADALMPDGFSIVKACQWLNAEYQPVERIAGWDLFIYEMNKNKDGRVMFMGSSEKVLSLIKERAAKDYPNMEVVTYSPPYKTEFSDEDNHAIINAINTANPDLLWIGMTAPKQEKWAYSHWDELNIHCHCGTIGAVFDFYAGTVKRAPIWWQKHGLEWLYRLISEPKRMWRRYLIGNTLFLWNIAKEKFA